MTLAGPRPAGRGPVTWHVVGAADDEVPVAQLPAPLARAEVDSVDAALERTVTTGTVLSSGLATSEPSAVFARLWDHVRANDVTDLEIRNGLFMAAHPLLLGDELSAFHARGEPVTDDSTAGRALAGLRRVTSHLPGIGDDIEQRIGEAADQLAQLRLLVDHLEELQERDIRFVSAFLSPASNTIIPDIAPVRAIAPRWAGRNRVTGGIVDYQPVHFPDAAWALSHRVTDGAAYIDVDVHCVVTTEPAADGRLSLGMSNGVDGDVMEWLHDADTHLLLVLSSTQPWVEGLPWAPNTMHVDELAPLVDAGRLTVVRDDTPVPSLPRGSFDATDTETTIGRLVADHVATHLDRTEGRALQVGIGGTGVQAIRGLGEGPWRGRAYTEMLDPLTWELVDEGTITGSQSLHDGTLEELDGQVLCTFALGEEGDGFADALDGDDRLRLAPSGHVLQEHAFHGGLGINNILGIDFNGHVNAFARDRNPWSGVGGQATIMRGLAVGGIAYLCCKSTHRTPDGEVRSSIWPDLPHGTPIALTGPDLFGTRDDARIFLVTEHGIACINGRSRGDFVRQIISVAHPDHRDRLAEAAWDLHRIRV